MPPRFVAQQLSNPRGIGGWLTRFGMNRGNARINAFTIDQLNLQPTDAVLEIGFGGGPNLARLLGAAASVTGADRSPDAVAAAERRYARECDAGRARFIVAHVDNLPLPDAAFTKALTVHTVYFWPSLSRGFDELHRTIKPGGFLAIGFLPKERMDPMGMPADIFTPRHPDELAVAANAAGFKSELRVPPGDAPWRVLLCRKSI